MPDMTPEQAHWFRAGIETAAKWHETLASMTTDEALAAFHKAAAIGIRALTPAAPQPSPDVVRLVEAVKAVFRSADRNGQIHFDESGDLAGQLLEALAPFQQVARAALAAMQAVPEPSEAKRMTAIEDRALLEMRRYTTNGAPCSLPWGSEDMT